MCELCDIIIDKEKNFRIMVNKCFVLHEEVIDFFHESFYIPIIEKLSFHFAHVRILSSMECGRTRNYFFHANYSKKRVKKRIMQKNSAEQLVQNYRANIAVELDNNQWKVSLLNIFQLILILVTMNRILNFIHIKVTTMNKMHVIHMRIWFIY